MKGFLFSRPSSPSPSHSSHNSYVSSSSSNPSRTRSTVSETMIDENVDLAEDMIRKWDVESNKHERFSSLFQNDKNQAKALLETVRDLQKAMNFYTKLSFNPDKVVRANNLMHIAIKRLEREFYTVLSSNRKNLDSESVSSRGSVASTRSSMSEYSGEGSEDDELAATPRASDIAVSELKSIADALIGAGYAKECINIYKIIRKSIIDETLYYLHVANFKTSQIQKMQWKDLEPKIKSWLDCVKVAVKNLFFGERILCDLIFSSSEKISESCFKEIAIDAAVSLFSFPQNFAQTKKILSPEKMFRALDMYETISDLMPDIEATFGHASMSAVRTEAAAALGKLREAVRIMFNQFESAIQKDSSNAPSNGGVHPLTSYVMNFLVFAGDYSGAVSDMLADFVVTPQTPLPESYFSSPTSAASGPSSTGITGRLAWLILVLLCKLNAKSEQYDDVALSYLFLANNLNYVVSKTRNSNLGLLIGSEWISENGSIVKEYLAKYERVAWNRTITALIENPTVEISENFGRFYANFEETYKKQRSWVIPDPNIRDEVKFSLIQTVVSRYQAFYQKHRHNYTGGFGLESVVRYAPEDLDNYISDLFYTNTGSGRITTSHNSFSASSYCSTNVR